MSGLEEELRDEGITFIGGTVAIKILSLLCLEITDHDITFIASTGSRR